RSSQRDLLHRDRLSFCRRRRRSWFARGTSATRGCEQGERAKPSAHEKSTCRKSETQSRRMLRVPNGERHQLAGGGDLRLPRSVAAAALIVIGWPFLPFAPPSQPPEPCQTMSCHSPAGAFLNSKLPFSSVTA